jgi:hypothetical protein
MLSSFDATSNADGCQGRGDGSNGEFDAKPRLVALPSRDPTA